MDTRCADPELQLDVDLMVLEYTLFQTIEAHLGALSRGVVSQDEGAAHGLQPDLAIFESFLDVFTHNHAAYEHSPEFTFRLQFLEFLVLLLRPLLCRRRRRSSDCHCCSQGNVSAMLLNSCSAVSDLRARRRWLARRERESQNGGRRPRPGGNELDQAREAWDLEQRIYSAWKQRGSPHVSPASSRTRDRSVLLSLLPRFMAISAYFVDVTKRGPSESWMDVACEFMLQAGLEALRLRDEDGGSECLPGLEDCFAWGYTVDVVDAPLAGDAPPSFEDDDDDDDDDAKHTEIANNPFRLRRHEKGGADVEDSEWTHLRLDTVQEFTLTLAASDFSVRSQTRHRRRRLEHLADKYPRADFQHRLARLLRNMWDVSCRADVLGKPVLVEIGEGHVQSRGVRVGADFERFALAVGLGGWSDLRWDTEAEKEGSSMR